MSRGKKKELSEEDRVLWTLVARTAKPLAGKQAFEPEWLAAASEPPLPDDAQRVAAPPVFALQKPTPKRLPPTHLDVPTLERLAKGKTPIEARVDLHGMTQDEAYSLLFSFLHRAHARGARYVLVITGKGSSSGGDGVLRRMVPGWLSTPAFRPFVSSHDHAARGHGGDGALYVRLRRQVAK